MSDVFPTNIKSWTTLARNQDVENQKPYLCLRVWWTTLPAGRFKFDEIGITDQDDQLAKSHLGTSPYFKDYLEHVKTGKDHKVPLRVFPELGVFTLVRHFQLQIPQIDAESSSIKHSISPRGTRSRVDEATRVLQQDQLSNSPEVTRPEIPNRQVSLLDLNRSMDAISTPSDRSRSSSGGRYRTFQRLSPLDPYTAHLEDGESLSRESSSHSLSDAMDGLSYRSATSEGATKVLYLPSPDEMIVNTSLILLLNAVAAFCRDAASEWNLIRHIFKQTLGKAKLEARTDGYMQAIDDNTTAIVEVKAHARAAHLDSIRMQESTQIVTAIASKGFPAPGSHRFIILSQDRHEIFLSYPDYDMNYIKYLKGEDAPKSFLRMKSYGPWNIYNAKDLAQLCGAMLALTISASKTSTP